MGPVKFGTDGWRAKVGDEFTFKRIRLTAQGYANFLKKRPDTKQLKIIINFDTGFLSRKFAFETARILSLNGVKTLIPNRDVPLAAVSLAIVNRRCSGGINFTVSPKKPVFNVLRIINAKGAPALPSETSLVENEVRKIQQTYHYNPRYPNEDLIESIDVKGDYVNYIESIVNLDLIKKSGIQIVVDNLFGTSREYLDYILTENGIDIVSIHNFPHSAMGSISSSFSPNSLKDLSTEVVERGADIGLATDISGDRFGIVDARGRYLPSNVIMPVLIEYLIHVREMEGGIVKSVSTTDNIKKVADYYLRKVFVTPVGFKYLADMLFSRKAFIGIESTNGASINQKVKMKDGILFNLLVTEMLAYYKMDLDKILANFYLKFPRLYCKEIALRENPERRNNFRKLLNQKKYAFNGLALKKIEYIDGIKFFFEDSWLLIRRSGTSDAIRIYAESPVLKKTKRLIKTGRSLIV